MIETLYEILRLLNDKHPGHRHGGFVKIYMYGDGSGMILDGPTTDEGNILLDFSNPEELIEYLHEPIPDEPESRE